MRTFIKKYSTPIGMLCLATGIIIERFGGNLIDGEFFVGLFIGISLPLILMGLSINLNKRKENSI